MPGVLWSTLPLRISPELPDTLWWSEDLLVFTLICSSTLRVRLQNNSGLQVFLYGAMLGLAKSHLVSSMF